MALKNIAGDCLIGIETDAGITGYGDAGIDKVPWYLAGKILDQPVCGQFGGYVRRTEGGNPGKIDDQGIGSPSGELVSPTERAAKSCRCRFNSPIDSGKCLSSKRAFGAEDLLAGTRVPVARETGSRGRTYA